MEQEWAESIPTLSGLIINLKYENIGSSSVYGLSIPVYTTYTQIILEKLRATRSTLVASKHILS